METYVNNVSKDDVVGAFQLKEFCFKILEF